MRLVSGMHCDLDTLTTLYGDKDVAQSIMDSAIAHETIAAIEHGDCTLPEPVDAREYHRASIIQDKFGDSPMAKAMLDNPLLHNYLVSLESRLEALEKGGNE